MSTPGRPGRNKAAPNSPGQHRPGQQGDRQQGTGQQDRTSQRPNQSRSNQGRRPQPAPRPGPAGHAARERAREQAALEQRRRRDRRILAIVAAAVVIVVVGGGIALQVWRTSRAPTAAPSTNASFAPVTITDGKPITLGRAGAPVRVTLYEDFHCPHCADFEVEFGSTITAAQEKGQALIELYPMSFIDAGSASAANAMACAAEAGFGQAYYTGLFANHDLAWSADQLVALAQKSSSSVPATFTTCVRDGTHQTWVSSINNAADAAGVTSTPTMFVNGQSVDIASLTTAKLATLLDKG